MKLTRSPFQERGASAVQIEPGEALDITYDPLGVNAPPGREPFFALAVRAITLPDGSLTLSIVFNYPKLYHDVPSPHHQPRLYIYDGSGEPESAEFVLNEEAPRRILKLKKVDYEAMVNFNSNCMGRCVCDHEKNNG